MAKDRIEDVEEEYPSIEDVDEVAREVDEEEAQEEEEREVNEIYEQRSKEGIKKYRRAISRLKSMESQEGVPQWSSEDLEEAMEEAFESTDVDDKILGGEAPQPQQPQEMQSTQFNEEKTAEQTKDFAETSTPKDISLGSKNKKDENEEYEEESEGRSERKKKKEKKNVKKSKKLAKRFKVTKSDYKELYSKKYPSGGVGSLIATSKRSNLLAIDRGPGDVGGPLYSREEGPGIGFIASSTQEQRKPFETEPRSLPTLGYKSKAGSRVSLSARINPPSISAGKTKKPKISSGKKTGFGALFASGGLGSGFASLIPKTTTKKTTKRRQKGKGNAKKMNKKSSKRKTKRNTKRNNRNAGMGFPFKV